jgi:hypothetical protein
MLGLYKSFCPTKAHFSFYVWAVAKYRKVDVLEWLQGKGNLSGNDRFSNEEIKKLDDYLRKLPNV